MISRREFLTVAAATAAVTGLTGRLGSLAAGQKITQDQLLAFKPKGQVTLLHMTDCHAQIKPVYFREPAINLGVGHANGLPPHITGADFLSKYAIKPGSLDAYMLTNQDFVALAREYGKVGGMDRMATLVKAIRAERGEEKVLFLDGGDTLHGSYTALKTRGGDMVRIMEALGLEATTGHWEFTLGEKRIVELFGTREDGPGSSKVPFLASNIQSTDFEEPIFNATKTFVKNGVKIAVIGQAFPYTPIANPRYMIPNWSFGIREDEIRANVEKARADGAEVVVLLSHNGFDVDRKLAGRVDGIDIILLGHTHDALPAVERVNNTIMVATGSSTKFLSRLDIAVSNGRMSDFSYALIPVLSDAIAPDPEMAKLVDEVRAPYEKMLRTPIGKTETVLYRRGNFNGSFDDLICNAMIEERDAEIAFSPGFRWGGSLLPGQDITWDDLYTATGMTYPACYRLEFTGERLKTILEDVCDNLFNVDPYFQQGGDMVRVGGMGYTCRVDAKMGARIDDMTLLKTGEKIDPARKYVVAGWASVNQGTKGPPIWDVVASYIKRKKSVHVAPNDSVKIVRG